MLAHPRLQHLPCMLVKEKKFGGRVQDRNSRRLKLRSQMGREPDCSDYLWHSALELGQMEVVYHHLVDDPDKIV